LVKSIRIELDISNISPNFGETSQKLIYIKLSIVSPEYLLLESFTIFDAHQAHAIPFIIIFFILVPFFTFLRHFPSANLCLSLSLASRWESHGLLVVSRCLRTMIFFLISIIVVTH